MKDNTENRQHTDILDENITKLLDKYPETDKRTIIQKFNKIQKDCYKLAEKIIPSGIVPLYINPLNPDDIKTKTSNTTWSEYNPSSQYGIHDDNYCRPMDNEFTTYQYPRRKLNGDIELVNCNNLINDDVKDIINISEYIPTFITLIKGELLRMESSNIDDIKYMRKSIDRKVNEYERVQQQYLQLVNLVNTNQDLIKNRNKTLDNKNEKLNEQENNYNIKQDVMSDYLLTEQERSEQNDTMIKYLKVFVFILWLVVLGLFLLHNIGYRL